MTCAVKVIVPSYRPILDRVCARVMHAPGQITYYREITFQLSQKTRNVLVLTHTVGADDASVLTWATSGTS